MSGGPSAVVDVSQRLVERLERLQRERQGGQIGQMSAEQSSSEKKH